MLQTVGQKLVKNEFIHWFVLRILQKIFWLYQILEERLFSWTAPCGWICSKQKTVRSKILQQGPFVPILQCHFRQVFCQLLNVYFNEMPINRWLHLSISLWGISLCCYLFRKKRCNHSVILGTETISSLTPKIWELVTDTIKNATSLRLFKKRIKL